MYPYFAIPNHKERKGFVNTTSPYSMFFTITFNIRKQDLINAFNTSDNLLVFTSEDAVLNYLKGVSTFDPAHPLEFKTIPIFQVELDEQLSFEDIDCIKIPSSKAKLISGKLTHLDFDDALPKNSPYIPLNTDQQNEIIYPRKCQLL